MAVATIQRWTFRTVLLVLGLAALPCLLLPQIAIVAAISIVGIPLALLMALIPPVFLFLLLTWAISFGVPGRLNWLTSPLIAVALLAVPPFLINRSMDRTTMALVSGDNDRIVRPFRAETLAVRSDRTAFWTKTQTRCDDFCMRALLTRSARRIMVMSYPAEMPEPDFSSIARTFHMERRASCPPVELADVRLLDLEKSPTARNAPKASERMRLEIAKGNCLIESEASLAEADTVVSAGQIKRGVNDYQAGLNPTADTIAVYRISVHNKDGATFSEVYRWTGVASYRLLPLLLPSYVTGYQFDIRIGFPRTLDLTHIVQFADRPDWSAFVTGTLGMELTLPAVDDSNDAAAVLAAKLSQPGPIDAVTNSLANDFFDRLRGRQTASQPDVDLAIAALNDRRLGVPDSVFAAAKYAKDVAPESMARLADALFARLFEIDIKVSKFGNIEAPQAGRLAIAIQSLPDQVIPEHRADLERLAKDTHRRVAAFQALTRLSVFGADAIPTMLYLIDDAALQPLDKGNFWQHSYLAGVQGLCRLGERGAPAIEPLLERIRAGIIPLHASYGDLAINTLAGMGADKATLLQAFPAKDRNSNRARFDRVFDKARRKIDCGY
ncbi:hypothetical protein LRP31_18240 [Mesorhizobium mediterraneum]|uniref:Uncharacterized protein n=1 Tax=Mesorhizobium mediterraneum TaxID=43617 RepID=A0AB36R5A8_9HYPH|nr:hypothetical protein [Mesorhizobium mediterraneum]PAQ00026.1 hypothetical protein CIT25_22275 [Mesorhizobium mediterraneum]RWN37939.1 MAG: hypothetical protein EOR96_23165 [Mesorhizobium sp.]WIW51039.1 hypothetical protein LRP31_18240 [Mesorhizobium mediterraneum]